jgi:chitodextrinase
MKTIKIVSMYLAMALIFFQCQENELIESQQGAMLEQASVDQTLNQSEFQIGNTYYVSTTGNDAGDGSSTNPWKTLKSAVTKVPINQGHTIKLSAGTFVESGLIEVPLGVNIEGAGKDQTIIKAASTFHYYNSNPGYATDKFLISLSGFNAANGNQILKGFTIDGDAKKLHGGIMVKYRNKVVIEGVKVQNTNFTGIWLWDVKDNQISNTDLINCSWGSAGWCSGALNLGNLERVDIVNLNVDENTGYGIKAIGPSGYNNIFYLKIHDSRVSVHPYGLWNGGSAPNIAIELWQVSLVGCEIYNTYVDNTISLVNSNAPVSTGIQTIRVHHNVLDMESRANGAGYGVELTLHDAEIDHNYFLKGAYGIANWDNPMKNWSIHHNVFYALQGTYPGEIVRSQWSGLHNVKLYNNTIEFAGTKTMNVVGVYGGTSENIDLKNNLVINSSTGYSYYPNQLIHRENGATMNNLQVTNNILNNLDLNVGGLVGGVLGVLDPALKNLTVDPKVNKIGSRPEPYYIPAEGSPVIDAGTNVGFAFSGSAPDLGSYESGEVVNALPQVNLTSPANNANFGSGSAVAIAANASDSDGSIIKVEFYQGSVKLGEDLTAPYSFDWINASGGTYSITAKATDNAGASVTSVPVSITVTSSNSVPAVSITSPASNSSFTVGSTITIAASASDIDGSVTKVEFFNGTAKLGEDLTSPYSFAWAGVTAGSYSLTAKATDNLGATKTSTGISVTVASGTTNNAPIVNITSPANNSTFTPGSLIRIRANASDGDGTIAKVEFYSDVTKIGQDLKSPYTFDLAAPAAGSYVLTVKAYDNKGAITTSSPIRISIATSTNTNTNAAPSVSLTSPVNNATLAAGSTLSLAANASDSDGSITKVEFYSGSTKLGEDMVSPYTFSWANISAGNYTVNAWAYDNSGGVSVSNTASITVSSLFAQVGLSASQAVLSGSMTIGSDAMVSSYFYVPAGYGKNYYIPPSSAASYSFQVTETDTYVMWVKVKTPSTNNQGYYIYDGKGRWTTWLAGVNTQWTWVKVKDANTGAVVNFSLTQGTNNIQFGWMDDNVQVDKVILTTNPNFVPN